VLQSALQLALSQMLHCNTRDMQFTV